MSEALKASWADRTGRERAVITFASILGVLTLAYAYIWLPVSRERDRLVVRVPELRAQAQAMESDARELPKLKALPSVELRTAIQQANAASRIPDTAVEVAQRDSTKVRIALAFPKSDDAFVWLARLQGVPGVRLESIRLVSTAGGDRVRVEAVLAAQR